MSILDDVIARIRSGISGFSGDEPLMSAAASAAALVITADGEIAQEEIETALADLMIEPTLRASYLPSALATELKLAIERTFTPAGREDNLAMVSAISCRSVEQRSNVLLLSIDVAITHKGISITESNTLNDLAERLNLDKNVLTEAVLAQKLVTGSGIDLKNSVNI